MAIVVGLFAGVTRAAPQRELGTLAPDQASGVVWHTAAFSKTFAKVPVVILSPLSANDAGPATARVRNVTTTGFEYQIDEWDYLDGVHAQETLSYLALEPGVHDLGGLTWEAGRVRGVGEANAPVSLQGIYDSPPVVLTQIESAVNAQALSSRVNSVTANSFKVRVHTQQSDKTLIVGESVGYVAVAKGMGEIDGNPFLAGTTGNRVTQAWKKIRFDGDYPAPFFFATIKSVNSPAPCALRYRTLTDKSVQLKVQEEGSKSRQMAHPAENVGYLVVASSVGETKAKLTIGSIIRDTADPGTWHAVTFDETYQSPVVVMGPPTSNHTSPVTVRVRNVTSTGFEFQLDGWGANGDSHRTETLSYLVMEEGTYDLGGLRWRAGKIAGVTNAQTREVLADPFASTPVVLAQVVTTNESAAVSERISEVAPDGFLVELTESEASDGTHAGEEVDYIAIESGKTHFRANDILFEVAATTATMNHQFAQIDFSSNFAAPHFLADMQTRNDSDPAVLRQRNLTAEGVEVKVEEEDAGDTESVHALEAVGFLVVAGALDRDEDGLPDDWELAHGLDPNDPNDAHTDPEGDGFDNLVEFRFGTNPHVVDTGGTITVVAEVADAFEKELSAAKFRIERSNGVVPVTVVFGFSGQASSADYEPVATSVQIPLGESSSEVLIHPVADALNEFPEALTLTILPNANYTVGATSAATVKINDATAVPGNEQLFVAFLTAQGDAETFAWGIGTLYLNGPKNAARVNLSFSGLTSNQTNAYLRYGVPQGIGPELRPTLPLGQLVNDSWTIVPVGPYSGQDIIDALFQSEGKYTYVNVGTGNYPAGEISGIWSRQTGSTEYHPPPDPPPIEPLSGGDLTRDVARLLTQATFGPKPGEIEALVADINANHGGDRMAGFNAWIDQQFARDQTRLYDYTYFADQEEWALRGTDPSTFTSGNEPTHRNRRRGWWMIAANAHDQLRQRVAFALSEIFVVSDKETEVRNRHYGAATYYDQLAAFADGNYRDLLESVSKSPIMGKYLSHLKNQKAIIDPGTGQVIVSPDENYAREVMQLFSIGLVQRHPDGTLKLGADGLPIATYNNNDITELARVFTGWSFSKRHGPRSEGYPVIDNDNFNQGNGPVYFQASWTNPMKNFAEYHDTGAKSVLGSVIAAGLDAEVDLDAALNILFNHPNVPPFISRLLIQRLVTSNPSSGYVHRVAQKFVNNGSGVRGDLKAVVKAILLDYEARSLDVVRNIGYGKQKEPIVRYVQLIRAMGGASEIPIARFSSYGYPAAQLDNFPAGATLLRYDNTDAELRQSPQRAPTVFNWFLPDFNPGGVVAGAGLVAPELQLTTETSVIDALNYHYTLANTSAGQSVDAIVGSTNAQDDDVRLDRSRLSQIYDTEIAAGKTVAEAVTTVLDYLDVLLLSGSFQTRYATAPAPNPRSIIIETVASMTLNTNQRMRELLYLVVTTPEYIHQK